MELKKHQIKCIEEIDKHFKTDNNGLIKMFCGSGKSFIIYDCLLKYGNNLSVVVVPSIGLVTQFTRDYLMNNEKKEYNDKHYKKIYELLSICSKNELDKRLSDIKFTTDENEILDFLEKEKDKIIVITYQSLELLFNVIKENDIEIDLICFDEAHHILSDGMKNLLFGTDEDDETDEFYEIFMELYVNKSLYFTATPKNSNGIKMYETVTDITINDEDFEILDDEDTYYQEETHCGKMVFEYMHVDGVNDNILNDFNIRVDLYTEKKDESIFDAISRCILETGNNRVLTFHSRSEVKSNNGSDVLSFCDEENVIKFGNSFKKILKNEFPKLKGKYKTIDFVGVNQNTKNRVEILQNFDNTPDNKIFLLSSCKTIGEGIDTKNADMVVFVDSKQSYVEIIQNIGMLKRYNFVYFCINIYNTAIIIKII